MNLIEGLQQEITRNKEILVIYEEIPQGVFGATMIKAAIKQAEEAMVNNDIVAMLRSYKELKGTK